MSTEQQIEDTKHYISNIQKEIAKRINGLKVTDAQAVELIFDISMAMSMSVTLGRLEYQLELETDSQEVINQLIK